MKKIERLTIRVNEETKLNLKELADKEDRSLNYYINKVLEKHVEKEKSK